MRKLLITILIISWSAFAQSGEVTRWIDAEGGVHFGNPQFAPAGQGKSVLVRSANGMDRPVEPAKRNRTRPAVAYVKKAAKKNPQGFRGYSQRRSRTR